MIASTLAACRRLRGAIVTAVGAALLAACSGGDPIDPFDPVRLVAFGDESSLIEGDGRKYSVNGLDDSGARDCTRNPLWVQSLASRYGLVFAECNPDGQPVTAELRAIKGAGVQQLRAELDDFFANGAPAERDLVAVLVGVNDVVEQYLTYDGSNEDTLAAELESRGRSLARGVNRIAQAGPAVIVLTVPDVGRSPYALREQALHADTDRAALISRLVAAINRGLRLEVVNDGRMIGMVFADEEVQAMSRYPDSYGLRNVTQAVCLNADVPPPGRAPDPTPLLGCTSAGADLAEGATATTWLWADLLRLAPTGQARLGSIAVSRATNNPF